MLKKAITIAGVCLAVLVLGLMGLALYALNRKEQNHSRIAPAAANRHKPKDSENSERAEMVVSPGSGGTGGVVTDPGVANG